MLFSESHLPTLQTTKGSIRVGLVVSILIFFLCVPLSSQSQNVENSPQELLEQARSIRQNDLEKSVAIAKQALVSAEISQEPLIVAQCHELLGDIFWEKENKSAALYHLTQAESQYATQGQKERQVIVAAEISDLLADLKRLDDSISHSKNILPLALEIGDQFMIARLLTSVGDGYYKKKSYELAIKQYEQAKTYLLDKDKRTIRALAQTYKRIAQTYKRLKNRELTAQYYRQSLDTYTIIEDKRNMARTLNTLSEAQRHLGNLVLALDYSLQGLKMHDLIDDPLGRAKLNANISIIYRQIGRHELSLKHILEAHEYYSSVNDILGIAKSSNQIGLLYTRLKKFEQARFFFEKTIDLPNDKLDSDTLAIALREMAVIYLSQVNYDKAMSSAKRAKSIYQQNGNQNKESLATRILGNIYREMDNIEEARNSYRDALALAVKVNNENYQSKALISLSETLVGNDDEEAIILLNQSLTLSEKINDKSQMLYSYRALRMAEKNLGNHFQALKYAEQELRLLAIIEKEKDELELINAKAVLHSHKIEAELEILREENKIDKYRLAKQNAEIAIANQNRKISDLELTKNRYAAITLGLLLFMSLVIAVLIYRRFIASKKLNEKLDALATKDPLTDCYNRRALFDSLDEDFKDLTEQDNYCVVLADIDHFKAVNDKYGHGIGDAVICGVAKVLQKCVKGKGEVARYGGEEFCILLPGMTINQAKEVAEKMRQRIENSTFKKVNVTSSFGISSINFNPKTPKGLINQADFALYKSKSMGRNKVTVWDKSLQNENTN